MSFQPVNNKTLAGINRVNKIKDAASPKEMSGPSINRELEAICQKESRLTDKFIEAGRGNERPSEYLSKTDPLATEARELFNRKSDLLNEAQRRYGPDFRTGAKLSGPIKSRY